AHHPIGSTARLGIPSVIERHEQQMRSAGIPAEIAHDLMLARRQPVAHALNTANYDRVVDAARQLAMPVMNVHLATDIIARKLFIEVVNRADGLTVVMFGQPSGQLETIPDSDAKMVH